MRYKITNTENTITYSKGNRKTVIIKRAEPTPKQDRYTLLHYQFQYQPQENYENRSLRCWQRLGSLEYARKLARDWVNNKV